MTRIKTNSALWRAAKALFIAFFLLSTLRVPGSTKDDIHLDVLKTGTQVYSNVTVTTRAKDYIFIQHAGGLVSVKLADLDEATRQALEYAPPPEPVAQATANWAKKEIAKLEPARTNMANLLPPGFARKFMRLPGAVPRANLPRLIAEVALLALAMHLFFSYCAARICRNAGAKPGGLIWVPGLQLLPLLHAASMSRWWCLGFLVPLLNLAVALVWCFKITRACGKGMLTTVLMMLPLTNLFAFLYLSFSSGKVAEPPAKPRRSADIMSLEAA